ncbi:c-type cytochrome biogenesis protein CcmI [Simiduia litorea]|uniref:c-type cytochrome biogenesis protein CcmI n=1 Tax=Simiduia litorea TaxID=1435348 RepID=UPI0036F2CD43
MTVFWIAALLMALVAGVFILWPLLFKGQSAAAGRGETNISIYQGRKVELDAQLAAGELDQQSHQAMLDELNFLLLDDTREADTLAPAKSTVNTSLWVLLLAAVLLPVAAGLWYWQHGASQEVALRGMMQHIDSPQDAEQVVQVLRGTVAKDPENTQNWFMLARLYMELGQYADATMAYLEVVNREPEAAEVVAEMAQALFLASNNQMTPEVRKINQRALQLNPENGTSLGLAGIDAFEQKRYQEAIDLWQKAMSKSTPGSPAYNALQGGVARAQAALGGDAAASEQVAGAQAPASQPDASAKPSIQVRVTAASQVPLKGQTLFVYARAWQGAKMPLAIQRLNANSLPLTVTLDDSMAMMAGMSLSSAGELEVIARLSASGSPAPQPGDWQAATGPVSLAQGSVALDLEIATQVPQ